MAWKLIIKDGQIQGKEQLWSDIKRYFSTVGDGRYIWPSPHTEKKTRSQNQNAYMWSVVYHMIADCVGNTPDETHQDMGELFRCYAKIEDERTDLTSREALVERFGPDVKIYIFSTTKMSTKMMEFYLEQVRRFAASELSIFIPLPNEPNNFYYDMD